MSDNQQEQKDTQSPPVLTHVQIGGKQVPWNKINKPHTRIIDPQNHKPIPSKEQFPDLEPAAKEREAKIAEERAASGEQKAPSS